MSDYVFESVSQALHFAGVMEMMPATTMSPTWLVIRALQEQAGDVWGHAKPETTMNLRGLSPLELRGQCALVVGAVNHHCNDPEAAAIWAHYGWHERKRAGVQYLSGYLAPGSKHSPEIVNALLWSIFAPRVTPTDKRAGEREGLTGNDIAAAYKIRVQEAYAERRRLAGLCHGLRQRGEDSLQRLFCRTELVASLSSTC